MGEEGGGGVAEGEEEGEGVEISGSGESEGHQEGERMEIQTHPNPSQPR